MDFHDALEQALRTDSAKISVGVLSGLHERGALDLDGIDGDKLTLFDRIMLHRPLATDHIQFLDSIGRSDVYAAPGDEGWSLMDRQLWFVVKNQIEGDACALALMIDKVQAQWWRTHDHPKGDEATTVVAALSPLSHAALPLRALWRRGVDPHGRLGNKERLIAVQYMTRADTVEAYIHAGGDLNAPAMLAAGKDYAMWRPIMKRCDALVDTFSDANVRGLIDSDQFELDHYLKKAHLARKNISEMMKVITTRDDWHEATTHTGGPVWMDLVHSRRDLLDVFIGRKRKRPDFSQRDSEGRTAWHLACVRSGGMDEAMFNLLDGEIPHQQHMLADNGDGLATQVLKTIVRRNKIPAGTIQAVLGLREKVGDSLLLAKIEQVDLTSSYMRAGDAAWTPDALFELLECEATHARLTPEQRGHIIAGCILGEKQLNYKSQKLWKQMLQQGDLVRSFLHLGVHWPDVDHARLQQYTQVHARDFSVLDGQPLLEQWVSCLQRQHIAKGTVEATKSAGQRSRL